ncbi:hypothetical protein BJ875DRAFT_388004, partial [Amylocarpus encephaloides]
MAQEAPNTSILPPAFNDVNRYQSNTGLQTFGDNLHAAAQALFPHQDRTRYSKVYVLLIRWETEPTLPVSADMSKLYGVFRDVYHFETEMWKIPDSKAQADADERIEKFVRLGSNSEDHLKIVCYAGNTLSTRSSGLAWTSGYKNAHHRYPTVQWSKIQTSLEQASSDVLVLLDCPHVTTESSVQGNGVSELIAACPYDENNNGVRQHSLIKELEAELRELSNLPSFSIGNLYDNLFCRNQAEDSEEGRTDPPPFYLPLTQKDPSSPQSLRLSIHEEGHQELHPARPTTSSSHYSNGDSIPSFRASSSIGRQQAPRIAFAIRLKDQFRAGDLSSDLLSNWLENIPSSIEGVRIEAAFHSQSSLLIVSVPICMSIYMKKSDAIMNLGPI